MKTDEALNPMDVDRFGARTVGVRARMALRTRSSSLGGLGTGETASGNLSPFQRSFPLEGKKYTTS
jgi:hypothetical protein